MIPRDIGLILWVGIYDNAAELEIEGGSIETISLLPNVCTETELPPALLKGIPSCVGW